MYRVTLQLNVVHYTAERAHSRGPRNVSGTIGFNGAARDHFYALLVDFHGIEINRKGKKERERERERENGEREERR